MGKKEPGTDARSSLAPEEMQMKKWTGCSLAILSVIGFASVASAQTPSNAIYTYRYNHIANGEYMQYFDFSAASTRLPPVI